jgi:ribosome biogenesis GTPase
MRELGLVGDDGGMDASFPDIASLAERCQFSDCQHVGEPGCAVHEAVSAGEIGDDRLSSYRKLQREVAAAERLRDPTLQGRSKRRWKSIQKAMRARSKIDPKRRK